MLCSGTKCDGCTSAVLAGRPTQTKTNRVELTYDFDWGVCPLLLSLDRQITSAREQFARYRGLLTMPSGFQQHDKAFAHS